MDRKRGKTQQKVGKGATGHDVRGARGGAPLGEDALRAASGGAYQAYVKVSGAKQGKFKGEGSC